MVAVIIATYQAEPWISLCLDSVLASDIPVDIYIVDNASTDQTKAILTKEYSGKIHLHCSPENLGFGKANNIALKQAYLDGHEYFFLLNQDAHIAPNTLSLLVNAFEHSNGYGILSPLHFNGKGDAWDKAFENYLKNGDAEWYRALQRGHAFDTINPLPFINAAGWMLNRKSVETVGLFNPAFFHYGEDNNYVDRLHYHGLKIGLAPLAKLWHHRENRLQIEDKRTKEKNSFLHLTPIELSRPWNNISIIELSKFYGKLACKQALTGQISSSISSLRKLKWIKRFSHLPLMENREQSRQAGMSFFEQTPVFINSDI